MAGHWSGWTGLSAGPAGHWPGRPGCALVARLLSGEEGTPWGSSSSFPPSTTHTMGAASVISTSS